jgi:hypothetical protein
MGLIGVGLISQYSQPAGCQCVIMVQAPTRITTYLRRRLTAIGDARASFPTGPRPSYTGAMSHGDMPVGGTRRSHDLHRPPAAA